MECHYCGVTEELRPYGPGGAFVCFPCAMSTPERVAQTNAALAVLMTAASEVSPTGVVVVGSQAGPQPLSVEAIEQAVKDNES